MATTQRKGLPYIYATWLTGLLAGEQSCVFSPWIRSHFQIEKRPSTFNFAAWKVDHTALLNKRVAELKSDGWTVTVEDQNAFKLTGTSAILAGKPDIVARKGARVLVDDAKTGAVRDSNSVQVALYMLVLPIVWKQPTLTLEGNVTYKDQRIPIRWEEVQPIREKLFSLIRQIGSDVRPDAVPSEKACAFCDVTAADCPVRFGDGSAVPILTSEF